jgi:hypothetical protein
MAALSQLPTPQQALVVQGLEVSYYRFVNRFKEHA